MIANAVRQGKVGMFATRDTVDESIEYAIELLKSAGADGASAVTAIMVHHNTVLEMVAKSIEEEENTLQLRVIDALMDTAKRTAELDYVYDDTKHDSVSWEEVRQVRAEIAGE
jgi:hypothetical protein